MNKEQLGLTLFHPVYLGTHVVSARLFVFDLLQSSALQLLPAVAWHAPLFTRQHKHLVRLIKIIIREILQQFI